MSNKLPLYELRVDEENDAVVNAIAIVDVPAVESNFFAFSKQSKAISYLFSSDEKREVIGAAMIPNLPIYRKDEDTGEEYEVVFKPETIRTIAQTFFRKNFQSNLNIQHTANDANSFVFQSFIIDSEKGINSPKGLNLPDGSWVIGVKILSADLWNEVKAGKFQGFSVEGNFMQSNIDLNESEEFSESEIKELEEILNEYSSMIKEALENGKPI